MSNSVAKIKQSLLSIDVTKLVKYTNKIKDIGGLSKMQASTYMQDFIDAIDLTNIMLMTAIRLDLDAKSALATAEAIAFLDKAPDYLKNKKIKDTSDAKKMYICIDVDVIDAKDTKSRTEAIVTFLKNKLQIFRYCHDDVKKIGYADQNMTNFAGF